MPGGDPQAIRFEPSQLALQVPVPVQVVREACGAPTTGMHVPALPPTSQASHWPAQGALQQTPSTQLPEPHSAAAPQLLPFALLQVPAPFALHLSKPHEDTWQQTPSTQLPLAHWPAEVQTVPGAPVVVHVVPLQK